MHSVPSLAGASTANSSAFIGWNRPTQTTPKSMFYFDVNAISPRSSHTLHSMQLICILTLCLNCYAVIRDEFFQPEMAELLKLAI